MNFHGTEGNYYDDFDEGQYAGNDAMYAQSMAPNMPQYYEDEIEMYDQGGPCSDEIMNSSPCPPERFTSRQANFSQHSYQYSQHHSEHQYPYSSQPVSFRGNFGLSQYAPSQTSSQAQQAFEATRARFHFSQVATLPHRSQQLATPATNQNRNSFARQPAFSGQRPPIEATSRSQRTRNQSPMEDEPPLGPGRIKLKPVSELPDIYRALFKFGVFNAVQSSCVDTLLNSTENLVVSAPTGSGKTVLFELAIIRMLMDSKNSGQRLKAVYIAPTKALCGERYRDWATKFDPLGIKCCELTGDTVHFGKGIWGDAKSATIIVTTGEKWDSLTRNWGDHSQILSLIQLFLVDEVHILNESRGSILEVVVSRMKLRGSSVRFVVVSATIPNIEDIAAWIGSNGRSNGCAKVLQFGEEFRPCKLTRHVIGVHRPKGQNDFVFAKTLDKKLFGALQTYSAGKPVLVFVSTRKGVFTTAELLAKDYTEAQQQRKSLPWNRPARIDRVFNDKRLADLAGYGIGVHHAGMTVDDRRAVEDLYMNKVLRIVVATSTLAVGVNLPAHTVVIRGVHTFQNNAVVEYSDLDVMQMLGRAGRPQFDKEGVAVILCENELEHKYRVLVQGQTVVESSLHNNLSEHLNSEIGLGTITDISSAKGWLKSSFLYRRIQRNPRHYSMNKDENQSWEERVDEIVTQSVDSLRESELIGKVDVDNPSALRSTEYGDIMSKFYIRQTTMCAILALPEHVSMRTVLEMISTAQELSDSKLRSSERSAFNNLRKHNDIRFEIKKLEKTSDKVFILIQAVLGGISLNDPEYKSGDSQMHLEAFNVFRHLPRIARAVVEVAITRKRGAQLKCGLELLRCFSAKAWEDRPIVLRQLESIGEKSNVDTTKELASDLKILPQVLAERGITSLEILRKQDALRIETLLNRKPPFGLSLLAAAHELPLYSLKVLEQGVRTYGGRSAVEVELSISCKVIESESISASSKGKQKTRSSNMTAVFTLTSDFEYIDFRRIPTKALKDEKTFELEVALEKPSQSIIVYITSEAYAGVTVSRTYRPNIASNEYPTRVTKPPSPMDIELEGLENYPELFSMEGIDENGEEIPPKVATIPVRDLSKPKLEATVVSSKENRTPQPKKKHPKSASDAWSPEPEKLPNGNYRCNHPCKDKNSCRHLCCREGLPKPPARSSKTHTSATQKPPPQHSSATHTVPAAHASNFTRPKPVPVKPNKKPNAKSDRTLQDLEMLHRNTNVEDNLKLPQGHRLKLDSPPHTQNLMHRKKKPVPDFNIEFSQVNDGGKDSYMSRELAELSDEELPDANDLFEPLTQAAHKRKRYSDDYDDPDMDFLIRTLPEDDAGERVSPTKETQNTQPIKRPKKRKEEDASRAGTPLFLPSTPNFVHNTLSESDDDIEFISSPHRRSDQEPPTSVADDFDDSVLDVQSFDVRPSTPDLEISTRSSDDDSRELEFSLVPYSARKESDSRGMDVSNRQVAAGQECLQTEEQEETMKDYMEEEFALLEAWLNSSAVDIVPRRDS